MGLLSALFEALSLGGNPDRDQIKHLRHQLEHATTFHEYEIAALALDFLEGRDKWKADPASTEYDSNLIQIRLKQLRAARLARDFERVVFLVRTSLSRNLGRMGSAKLYAFTYIGTKHLIEEYIAEVQYALRFVFEHLQHSRADVQDTIDVLLKTRQSFGRTALLLSGGGTLGMMHIGVIKTLFEENLLPRIICGSSAGAIVAAVVCTKPDDEMNSLTTSFAAGNLNVFDNKDQPESIFTRLARFLKHGVFMEIGHLRAVMEEWMGDITFGEAFNKTRRILNITVSSASIYEMPRLLNYITAPNVIIWSAVAASSSLPLIFSGSPLMAKDPRTGERVVWDAGSNKCIDGSIEGDLPTTRLSELFNIDHFIVSQVNPHVTPFLPKESHELEASARLLPSMAVNEILHISEMAIAMGIAPNLAQRIAGLLSQPYIGNITILPEAPMIEGFLKLLANPTPEFMNTACRRGEKATWGRMSIIRNHLQIEVSLDQTLHQLRLLLIGQTRPIRQLRQSQSQYFSEARYHSDMARATAQAKQASGPHAASLHIPHHRRRRSSSIVSNISLELDPADIAPTRQRTAIAKSQPATPASGRASPPLLHPQGSSHGDNRIAELRQSLMPPSDRLRASRRPSYDQLSGTGLSTPATPALGLSTTDYFAPHFTPNGIAPRAGTTSPLHNRSRRGSYDLEGLHMQIDRDRHRS